MTPSRAAGGRARPCERGPVPRLRAGGACLIAVVAMACARPPVENDTSRSNGLPVASLSLAQQVAVYDAAVHAAFDVGPDLSLVTHPRQLPRGAGLDGGDPLPVALGEALRKAGVTRGSCEPVRRGEGRAPLCSTERSGYLIRATEIFKAGGDTLRMNLLSEIFAAAGGKGQEPFSFEMAYKLVPRGAGSWRVVAEGRVREKQ